MNIRRSAGFTLMEIMAVVVIIGLSIGTVALVATRGGPEKEMWDEIERFMAVSEFASERAILSGEPMGLLLEPPAWQTDSDYLDDVGWRYRWQTLTHDQGWQDLPNLPAVSLPPTIELEVSVNDRAWEWRKQLDRQTPVASYYPSGDVSDLQIVLRDKRAMGYTQTIEVDEKGELVWVEAPEIPKDGGVGF